MNRVHALRIVPPPLELHPERRRAVAHEHDPPAHRPLHIRRAVRVAHDVQVRRHAHRRAHAVRGHEPADDEALDARLGDGGLQPGLHEGGVDGFGEDGLVRERGGVRHEGRGGFRRVQRGGVEEGVVADVEDGGVGGAEGREQRGDVGFERGRGAPRAPVGGVGEALLDVD